MACAETDDDGYAVAQIPADLIREESFTRRGAFEVSDRLIASVSRDGLTCNPVDENVELKRP